jgi:WD40 repeat protein
MLSWAAHSGWVSCVQFVNVGASSCHLLTTSNDGLVKLWSAARAHNDAPQLLSSVAGQHRTHVAHVVARV